MEEDFETTEETQEEETQEEDNTPVFEFDEEVHPPGEEPRQVQLTKADLDPRNDPKLKVLFNFIDDPGMVKYFQMPSLRGLVNHVKSIENSIKTDYVNYKKRGRI